MAQHPRDKGQAQALPSIQGSLTVCQNMDASLMRAARSLRLQRLVIPKGAVYAGTCTSTAALALVDAHTICCTIVLCKAQHKRTPVGDCQKEGSGCKALRHNAHQERRHDDVRQVQPVPGGVRLPRRHVVVGVIDVQHERDRDAPRHVHAVHARSEV